MNSNKEYTTVVIDVPVDNINNIRMILPQTNGMKIQPVVATASPLLTSENTSNDNNLIEEEPPPSTPVMLDDLTAADILVQPLTADVATSTSPDLTNGELSSPSVSNSELDMQIACMDPTKNASQQLNKYVLYFLCYLILHACLCTLSIFMYKFKYTLL